MRHRKLGAKPKKRLIEYNGVKTKQQTVSNKHDSRAEQKRNTPIAKCLNFIKLAWCVVRLISDLFALL